MRTCACQPTRSHLDQVCSYKIWSLCIPACLHLLVLLPNSSYFLQSENYSLDNEPNSVLLKWPMNWTAPKPIWSLCVHITSSLKEDSDHFLVNLSSSSGLKPSPWLHVDAKQMPFRCHCILADSLCAWHRGLKIQDSPLCAEYLHSDMVNPLQNYKGLTLGTVSKRLSGQISAG